VLSYKELPDIGEGISNLEVTLYTGRTHQIRAHLAHIDILLWATANTESTPSTVF